MQLKTNKSAILFVKSGSSHLLGKFSNNANFAKAVDYVHMVTKITEQNMGSIIKVLDEEIMCAFPTADNAANAASEIYEALEENEIVDSLGVRAHLTICIGFHFGPISGENGDVAGDAVNIASCMADEAKNGQIVADESTIALLPAALRASARFVDHISIKGIKEKINIYELIWEKEDITRPKIKYSS